MPFDSWLLSRRPPLVWYSRSLIHPVVGHREPRLGMIKKISLLLYYSVAYFLPDSNFPGGKAYRSIREFLCSHFFAFVGKQVNIESRVFVADGSYIRIGAGSGLGTGSRVYGAWIGENVIVGPNVVFLKDNHLFGDLTLPIQSQGLSGVEVPIIEDWSWIGERAIILPGRRVGKGAIVGAGAVVTKDVSPFEIVGGNPARQIGHRASPDIS